MENRFHFRLQYSGTTVCAILSATVGTRASYCVPFQALCGLGFDVGGELV